MEGALKDSNVDLGETALAVWVFGAGAACNLIY